MMEKSCNSSLIKGVPSKQTTYSCTEEESGWTAYFEDFSNTNNRREEEQAEEQSLCSSFGCTSSLVSDAASGAAWKRLASHNNQSQTHAVQHACSNSIGGSLNNFPKKLSFKKTRIKKISGDDLEDTASSPVNSPKIGDLRPVGINPRKIDGHHININSLDKDSTTVEHFAELQQADDHEETADCFGKNNDSTSADLEKKGLCLAPMSLLVNYLV